LDIVSPKTRQVREFDVETGQDTRIAFAENDRTIAVVQRDKAGIAFIDIGSGKPRPDAPVVPGVPWGVAVDPTGHTLFTNDADANAQINIWDIAAQKSLGSMAYTLAESPDSAAGGSLSVSPDGHWLATSGGDRYVRVYDITQKKSWRALAMDESAKATNVVAFSPDGSKLAALATNSYVYIWSFSEQAVERYAVLPGRARGCPAGQEERGPHDAAWLAWVTDERIALTVGCSSTDVLNLDSAEWQRRIGALAPAPVSTVR
jgi:WD40 repeat protein